MGAQGTTSVDFGTFPGACDASIAVTGQAGIVAGSLVEAWLRLEATATHTIDEHFVEPIQILAGNIVAGTGFTIYAKCVNPAREVRQFVNMNSTGYEQPISDNVQKLNGLFTVAWVWN